MEQNKKQKKSNVPESTPIGDDSFKTKSVFKWLREKWIPDIMKKLEENTDIMMRKLDHMHEDINRK